MFLSRKIPLTILFSMLCSTVALAVKPNIIIIVADDLGHADIGAQGVSRDVKTPNIDSIAAHGARFTNAYVSAPVCSPSRAGFLTGRYQQRFGHEANPQPGFDGTFGLPLDQVTLAVELKHNGYATGMMGKWHLGSQRDYRPPRRGFDEFYGFLGGAHAYNRNGVGDNALLVGDKPVDETEYLTDAITREAVAIIDRHHNAPFFLYLPYNAVHTPQIAPPKYLNRFADEKDEKRRLMLAMLSAEDDGVGRILAKLHDAKIDDNTLIVFLSDNGGPTDGNGSRNAPFRGFKGQLWEGGIRIPFMMQWPGHVKPGQVVDSPMISLDIFPTVLAAAGIKARAELKLDGVNLLPWLQGGFPQTPPHEVLFWRFQPQWAIREGQFKLVKTRDAGPMLFDLAHDPSEQTDLTKSKPDVAKRLREKFDAWNAQLMDPLWPGRQEGARPGKQDDEQ